MDCKHDWKYQRLYSPQGWSVGCYKCDICGIWAYKRSPAACENIIPYKGDILEPNEEWCNDKEDKWPTSGAQPDQTERREIGDIGPDPSSKRNPYRG